MNKNLRLKSQSLISKRSQEFDLFLLYFLFLITSHAWIIDFCLCPSLDFILSFSFLFLFICLCHYPQFVFSISPHCLCSRSFSFLISPPFLVVTGRPLLLRKFSQPPHPLIFHQLARVHTHTSTPPLLCTLSLSVNGTNAFVQYLQQTD